MSVFGSTKHLLASLVCLYGCGGAATKILPQSDEASARTRAACERVFPSPPFEATHVVEVSVPLSDDVSLIGVVAVEQAGPKFRSVLMTQEGVVLFDAQRNGKKLDVVRAVSPLDPEGFGRHMTDDVALILTHPTGKTVEVGHTSDGVPICRWTDATEQVELRLISPEAAQLTRILDGSVVRRAWLNQIGGDGFARDLLLETTSLVGYQLHLQLIEVNRDRAGATNPG